jgi:uncharacterized membrane protein YccC
MSDVTEQDEVLAKRFYDDTGFTAPAKDRPASHEQALRHELWRTWRILAALREPSREMREAVHDALNARKVTDPIIGEDIDEIIEAAVAAAEQEVRHDEG